jgi:hypothetical protein
VGRRLFWGLVESYGDIGSLGGKIVVEESSVEIVLRFSKENGVEDLGIEPKLHCNHFLEVWHLFLVKTCCNYRPMMLE